MIAARLAGGNLFLPFWVGDFWSTRSSSEHSEHSDFFEGIFWWGIFLVGDSFFWGGGVCFGLKVLEKIKK